MQYQLTDGGSILRLDDGAFIPQDPANTDYCDYLAWLAEGNTPSPALPALPTVPEAVTMRQARLALLRAGMLSQVDAMVAAADVVTRITWEFSSEVQRTNPLVLSLASSLGLTDEQLDNLFILADTL